MLCLKQVIKTLFCNSKLTFILITFENLYKQVFEVDR